MKSAILISTLWMLASASAIPVDESSSSVNVKQGGHEYSYHIQQSHGIDVVPIVKSSHDLLDSLQPKSSEGVDEKTEASEQLDAHANKEAMEKQSLPDQSQGRSNEMHQYEQLRFVLPGYHLLPSAENGMSKEGMEKQLKIALPEYQLVPGGGLIKEGLEKQLAVLPGYKLLPANANIQYTSLPYYYPYLQGYGLHYPHNVPLVRYI